MDLFCRNANDFFDLIQTDLFAGAVFIETILKWKLYPAVGMLLVFTAAYTMAGKRAPGQKEGVQEVRRPMLRGGY